MNGKLRLASEKDIPRLRSIWQELFEDDDDYMDRFFGNWSGDDLTSILYDCGGAVSAAHILSLGDLLIPGHEPVLCRETYALGTLPGYRGNGYGLSIAESARDIVCDGGVSVLCPAEPSLYGYYGRIGYGTYFYAERFSGPAGAEAVEFRPIDTEEYAAMREDFLSDRPHIKFTKHALDYEKLVCDSSGGGLFRICTGDDRAICSVEIEGSCAVMKEMLCTSGDPVRIAERVCRAVNAENYSLFIPASSYSSAEPYAMICPKLPESSLPPWFGFSYD